MKTNQLQNDFDILKRFNKQANILAGDKYNNLNKYSLTLSVDEKSPSNIHSEFPNDDLLKSFLMNLRFFILKDKNNFNFEKICQFFIEKNFEKDEVLKWLDVYNRVINQDVIELKIGDQSLTNKMIFFTILNEDNFHQELEQKGMSKIKASPLSEPIARIKFFNTIENLRRIICSFNKRIVEKYLINYEN